MLGDKGSVRRPARRRTVRRLSLVTVIACLAGVGVAAVGVAPGNAAPAAAGRVVVVLKDQAEATPATAPDRARRASTTMREQQSVLSGLPGGTPGHITHFSVGNAFAATATPAQSAALAADPAVAEVVPDEPVEPVAAKASAPQRQTASGPLCPADPAHPLVEPEALGLIHAGAPSAHPVDGSGIRVGFIADGVDPDNPDFIRPNGQHLITDYQDFTGQGTTGTNTDGEAFGDVSAIAAQGTATHDLHDYDPSIPAGCTVRIVGVAPGADVVALKGIGGTLSSILQSIDYAVNVAHVDVLNESFTSYPFPDSGARTVVGVFNDAAIAAGVTVVAASGDAGVTSTIGSPAADPQVISVGATTSLRLQAQLGDTGTNGRWADGNIADFSSAGFTAEGHTVDLVAPGFAGWADCTPGYGGCVNAAGQPSNILDFAGTSQSAPLTSGAAALVIQAYRQAHGGQSPTPAVVKRLITSTAANLGASPQEQGAGLLDVQAAIEAARDYQTVPTGQTSHLVLSTDQLDLTGPQGSTGHATLLATNAGRTPLRVTPSVQRFVPQSSSTRQVSIAAGSAPTPIPITVPAGADQLVVRAVTPTAPGSSGYHLYAPDGTLENVSVDGLSRGVQLSANRPQAGTWTLLPPAGLSGTLTVQTDTLRSAAVGGINSSGAAPGSFVLPGEGSRPVSVTVPLPTGSGDDAYEIAFVESNGTTTTVPIVVRSLVPINHGTGHFTGTFTTGAGRIAAPAETITYAFDVPAGAPALTVSTVLAPAASTDEIAGVLVAPNGETPSVATNAGTQPGLGQTVPHPASGRWRLILVLEGAPQNAAQAFTGTIGLRPALTVTGKLPSTDTTRLPAGKPVDVPLTITNPGPLPETIGIDPRTTAPQPLSLTPLSATIAGTGVALRPTSPTVPLPNASPVSFLVPPGTSTLAATSAADVPNQVLLTSPTSGIEAVGSLARAKAGSTTSTATVAESTPTVTDGLWSATPQQIGPFGAGGAPSGTAAMSASALAPGFDRSVTSPDATDQFLLSVDPNAPAAKFVTVPAGGTATVTVTITPTGTPGTRVHGVLNLVTPVTVVADLSLVLGGVVISTGDTAAALPYTYTVG